MITLQHVAPEQIEAESFRIIAAELGPHRFSAEEFQIVQRIIHATADFSYAEQIRFHPQAVARGLAALRAGKDILVDVQMAQMGVSKQLLARCGGQVHCLVGDVATATLAQQRHCTRSEAALLRAADELGERLGLIAVGNAPTALLAAMELCQQGRLSPDLLIGVPVGFVNAAESKALLLEQQPAPFITVLGRKGGTPAAVASINALLRLA